MRTQNAVLGTTRPQLTAYQLDLDNGELERRRFTNPIHRRVHPPLDSPQGQMRPVRPRLGGKAETPDRLFDPALQPFKRTDVAPDPGP